MPKKTFENLPEPKKQKILTAVRNEFLTHPYSEISLNRIIKEADIPRGSIYQYFDGKEDMLFVILDEYCTFLIAVIIEYLKENHGDIFCTVEAVLRYFFGRDEKRQVKMEYAILFADLRVVEMITDAPGCCEVNACGVTRILSEIRPYLNISGLDLKAGEEEIFLQIMVDALCKPIVRFLNDGIDRYEECMKRLKLMQEHFEKKDEKQEKDEKE